MKYEIIKDKTLSQIITENNIYKYNVKIFSIRETYLPNSQNVLTNEGVLYIEPKVGESLFKFNIFNAKDPSFSFDKVQYIPNIANMASPNYEATHRLVLFKDKRNNQYYADPIYLGKQKKYEYLFILDTDFIPGAYISSTGYFVNKTKTIDHQYRFYFNYNHLLYINIPNIDMTLNQLNLKIIYNDGSSLSESNIGLNQNETYITIPENNDRKKIDDYTQIELYGTVNSPDQLIMEVF